MSHDASIAGTAELKSAIERAEGVREALDKCGRKQQAAKISEIITSAQHMRFAIGVVGHAKRGKSTLINGLLGRSDDMMAPVDRFPATNVVSCFADGAKQEIKVFSLSEGGPPKLITATEIKQYACEEFNPGNRKGVKAIEVIAPFPRLGRNVVLVDTPGADNALSNVHDLVLLDYLPRLDAVIFLVTADEPLTGSETELLKQVRRSDVKKLLFAVNKVDKVEPDELSQGIAHNRRTLADVGYGDAPIFAISAKNYQKTGGDDGTEQLLFAVGELITEGRAKAIAERLTEITDRSLVEAKADLSEELELCGKTSEQIGLEKAELANLREAISRTRPGLERKFRTEWQNAFSEFDDALPAIEKQMVAEYNELVASTSSLRLQSLGNTIHTDMLKRLDELLDPYCVKLRSDLDEAVKSLQVEYCGIIGLSPRQIQAITNHKDFVKGAVDVLVAGVPSALGAFALSSLPGLVGSAIVAAGPAVAHATLNPLTWLPALGTGAAAGATGLAGGAAAAILSPLAAIGAPLLIGYAGYRIFSTWRSKVDQSKNVLSLAIKDLIISVIAETRRNIRRLKDRDETILSDFNSATTSKLDEYAARMDELLAKRPAPERLADLKLALLILERLEPPKALQAGVSQHDAPDRLFRT